MDLADNFNAFRTSEAVLKALSRVPVRLWLLPRPGSIAGARYITLLRKWSINRLVYPLFIRYFNNNVKWSDAVNLCDDEHSSLASLESIEEETSVRSLLASDEGTDAWIGLSDRVNPDSKSLIWVDGNTIQYSNWNTYQDDVTEGRKCGTLSIGMEGWMYKNCMDRLGFICKIRLKGEEVGGLR